MNNKQDLPTTEYLTPTSSGMVQAGVQLYYETFGSKTKDNKTNPVIVLIMGVGQQCIAWPDEFCQLLVDKGFYVVRFDNRDIGLSEGANSGIRVDMRKDFIRYKLGMKIKSNYQLYDMAADVIGLLDALEITQAHIAGMSMGGMIAQITAALYPSRVASLSVIMSSTNCPSLPRPELPLMLRMAGIGVKRSSNPEIIIEESFKTISMLRGSKFKTSDDILKARIARAVHRRYRPIGYLRQANAILATGSFEHVLPRIQAPTVVIHGTDDPLLKLECGKRVAKCIPNARKEIIEGLGHEFPCELNTVLTALIEENTMLSA